MQSGEFVINELAKDLSCNLLNLKTKKHSDWSTIAMWLSSDTSDDSIIRHRHYMLSNIWNDKFYAFLNPIEAVNVLHRLTSAYLIRLSNVYPGFIVFTYWCPLSGEIAHYRIDVNKFEHAEDLLGFSTGFTSELKPPM